MAERKQLICPACGSNQLYIRYEATYVYSYALDSDAPGKKNTSEFLPYLYDNREQTGTKQYIECIHCKAKFQCIYDQWDEDTDLTHLQESLNADYRNQLEYS